MEIGGFSRRTDIMTQAKNTICLWYDKDAEEAANFYAATFPDSEVTAVHKARFRDRNKHNGV